MEENKKANLIARMESARYDYLGFVLVVKNKNSVSPEHIINPPENITDKIAYITSAYDDDLKLKANQDISIIMGFPKNVYHV